LILKGEAYEFSEGNGKTSCGPDASRLERERLRYCTFIGVYGNRIAAKGLKKRLREIDKRIAREARDQA
jgi:hypothetical protein